MNEPATTRFTTHDSALPRCFSAKHSADRTTQEAARLVSFVGWRGTDQRPRSRERRTGKAVRFAIPTKRVLCQCASAPAFKDFLTRGRLWVRRTNSTSRSVTLCRRPLAMRSGKCLHPCWHVGCPRGSRYRTGWITGMASQQGPSRIHDSGNHADGALSVGQARFCRCGHGLRPCFSTPRGRHAGDRRSPLTFNQDSTDSI